MGLTEPNTTCYCTECNHLKRELAKLRALLRLAGACGVCASRSYMRCPVVDESMKPEYAGLFPKEAKHGRD